VGADMFSRSKKHVWSSTEMQKLGRLEAEVETLTLKWTLYRDEMKKLVNRLEKVWERQEKKLRRDAEQSLNNEDNGDLPIVDEITARVNARRAGHGVHGP